MASVVDCKEREIEASGTAQSQEVAETPQKGWEDGGEKTVKSGRGRSLALGKQLLLPGPLWKAEAALSHSQTNLPRNF